MNELMNQVTFSNCFDLMKKIDDNSISMILTDPPYFIDGMGDDWNFENIEKRSKKIYGVINGALPTGMKFDKKQGEKLQEYMIPLCQEWNRIIKPGGFVFCFSQNRLSHHMAIAIEKADFEIRDMLLWNYDANQPKAFSQNHFIRKKDISEEEKSRLIKKLGNRKTPQLKPQGDIIIMGQAEKEGTFIENWDKWETGLIDVSNPLLESGMFPGTVMYVPKVKKNRRHITEKPVDLLRHLIRIFSVENSIIFDPFSGSGSTGEAARLESRRFIGSEINKRMARIANERVVNTKEEQTKFDSFFE